MACWSQCCALSTAFRTSRRSFIQNHELVKLLDRMWGQLEELDVSGCLHLSADTETCVQTIHGSEDKEDLVWISAKWQSEAGSLPQVAAAVLRGALRDQ